jgi:hypothetical protein
MTYKKMGNILLGLFILSNVFAKGFCHEYQGKHFENAIQIVGLL